MMVLGVWRIKACGDEKKKKIDINRITTQPIPREVDQREHEASDKCVPIGPMPSSHFSFFGDLTAQKKKETTPAHRKNI